jgi:glucan phosphoethanolaminetransferase (alkaline phosphatase superfamily)
MIQRIQTVYLALIIVLYIILIALPIATFQLPDKTIIFKLFKTTIQTNAPSIPLVSINYLLIMLDALIVSLSLFCITKFKNRKLQIKLTGALYLIIALFIVTEYFLQESFLNSTDAVIKNYHIGTYFPIFSLILVFLAQRNIKKDEELVRSADRLR